MQSGWLLGVGDTQDFRELRSLAADAGVEVLGETWQRGNPHPNTYLGSGRLTEVAQALPTSVDVILINDPLSPRQERLIEAELDRPVLDWTGLILDVFARRATTAEGKLQVELAQAQYLFGRARGLWTHLDRLGVGGVGARGPGETQLESDRRMIRQRMVQLERRVAHVGEHRERLGDRTTVTVAIAGYTNAGKTTLLGTLSDPEIRGTDMLFATLDPQRRSWRCGGMNCQLADTVGLIDRLPTELVRAFDATLSIAADADIVLHLLDASDEDALRQYDVTEATLDRLGTDAPRLLLLTKTDLCADDWVMPEAFSGALVVNALTGDGIDAVELAIIDVLCAPVRQMTVYTRDLDAMRQWGAIESIERHGATSSVMYRPRRGHEHRWHDVAEQR